MERGMKKRIVSLFLAILMCMALLPASAFAEEAAQIDGLPKDGDRIVICNAQYEMALNAEETDGCCNTGVRIVPEDGAVFDAGENLIWTVSENEDGTYRFSQNDRFLSMGNEDPGIVLDGENPDWIIEAHGDGFSIKNAARESYLMWNADENCFVTDAAIDDSGAFDFLFYQPETVTAEEPAEEPTEPVEEPEPADTEEPAVPSEPIDTEEPEEPAEHEPENPDGGNTEELSFGHISEDIPGSRTVTEAYLRGDMETYYRLAPEYNTRDTLPSKYDARNYGYVTPVRNQNPYGSCWAHAAMACVESYMIKHGVPVGTGSAATTSLNLSETHLCFFTYTNAYDAEGMLTGDSTELHWDDNCLDEGGLGYYSTFTLMRWTGAASESVSALAYSNASTVANSGLDSKYAYNYDVSHVQEVVWIPGSDVEAVKRAIMEYGTGDISYDATYGYTYTCNTSTGANHEITVVGWDDTIAVNKFSPSQPSKPGAWICKNSWGTGWGNSGYCYISYEDAGVCDDVIMFYKAEPVDNYDHNYQYDGTICTYGRYLDNGSKIANVFTAKRNESLQAISFATYDEAVSYTVEIYKNPSSGNPSSGTKMATKSGSLTFPGYYTVKLNSPILLSANDTFSVVITLSCQESRLTVPYDRTTDYCTHVDHGNTSYYKTPSGSWTDCPNNGDFRIKAYTDDATTVTVTFNANGGTVSPTSKTVTVGSTYGTLPTPTRTGYEFAGWFIAPDEWTFETLVTETTTVTTTSNHTLYAGWVSNLCSFDLGAYVDGMFDGDYYVDGEYTDDFEGLFTYDLYLGGTQIDDDTTNAHDDFPYGTHYEIKDIKPAPGKRFDGVHIGSLSGTITGDTMIVLLFSTEKYTVTFNANGGTVSPTSKTVTYGSKYGDLPTPTRTGYTFNGWYTAASGGSKVTSSTTVTTASNHTLYAHWTPNQYTVTFDANDGSGWTTSQKVTYDSTYGTLPTRTRTGYTFNGWYTAKTGGTKITSSSKVTTAKNHTLYAQWTANKYAITFNANGGSVETASMIVTYDSAYGTLPTPTRTGYKFTGWYTAKTGGTKITSSTKVTTASNHTLYAQWTPRTYTVSFSPNGGSMDTTSIQVTYGSTYGTLPTPTKTGYTFDGWYTAATSGTKITSSTKVTTASNHRLYAHWTANQYTVSFSPNGGSMNTTNIQVTYGSTYGTLPTPTKTGYTFDGWYTATTGGTKITSSTKVTTVADHRLYAHWTARTYTVKFSPNGGSMDTTSITVTYGSTYGELPTPTLTGYKFDGWYTAVDGGTKITSSTKVTTAADHRLYAHWTANTYTVKFSPNGGNMDTTSITVTYGSTYGELPTPKLTGYAFDGWYTAATGGTKITASSKVTTAADHRLYAHWTPRTYTVKFSPNGGSMDTTSITVTYGSTYGTLPTPTQDNYVFDGWYTAATGGTKITSSTKVATAADHRLYAHWTGKAIDVYFNAKGGEVSEAKKTVNYAGTYGTLPTPTRTGYTFNGWYTAATDGTEITSSTKVTSKSNHTLYAQWTPRTYTVSFSPNGGSMETTSMEVTYDSIYGTLPTPTKTGYTFDGWYTAVTDGTKITSSTKVTTASNHRLYAHWTARTYTVYFSPNGGSMETTSMEVTYGSTYGDLPTPTREKFVFDGWYTAATDGTKVTSSTKVKTASNHRLYAHWTKNTATSFDGTIEWNSADVQYNGTTPYVVYNGSAQTPRFTVKDKNGNVISASNYTYEYRENTNAGTGYVFVTFKDTSIEQAQQWFKIYLPATTETTVENVNNGILVSWAQVDGAAGYVIYRRAWSSTTNGWTSFSRWDNTTDLSWTDTKVYAGTAYQYGIKAYFAERVDPVSGATIGGNVGDNYNLGLVGPMATNVRISTRTLTAVTVGSASLTVQWDENTIFTGYEVQIATNANFTKNVQTAVISDSSVFEKTFQGLTSGTRYYARVRSYHEFGGVDYYGAWSNVLNGRPN